VSHILLTHNHFDHILGSAGFPDATIFGARAVTVTMTDRAAHLRVDALRYGADADQVDAAMAAMRPPDHEVLSAIFDLGEIAVSVSHPGRGHTNHDLIAVLATDRTVVFCGDLVEESGDPCIDDDSDLEAWPATLDRLLSAGGADAVYVPGHGAVVDAEFVRRQRQWLARRSG
jgi:glyoxylase-like metal-dependent hydrolase (beta-lactamase superfamily II)